jgi:anti-anti-sigma factor
MKCLLKSRDSGVIVDLEGDADLATVPEFQKLLREQIKAKPPWLVIDFSLVTFVNTPVWAVVVEYYQHARSTKTGLALAGLKSRVAASFSIVRLGDFIANFPTVEEAVAAFKG